MLISNDYLPALTNPNVEVVTEGIAEVRGRSMVDNSGVEREVDTIIYGTGFRPTDPPLAGHVRGRAGRTLAEVWAGSPRAHAGTTVAGFPNLFILLGPNTGLGHNSVVYMIEAQIEHMLSVLGHAWRLGASAVEPRAEAQAAYVAEIEKRMEGTVWVAGGCASWYLGRDGAQLDDLARLHVALPPPRRAPEARRVRLRFSARSRGAGRGVSERGDDRRSELCLKRRRPVRNVCRARRRAR